MESATCTKHVPCNTVSAMTARRALLMLMLLATACGGSPNSPSATGSGAFQGAIVNALDGQPISQVTVKVGTHSGVSDASGAFQVPDVPSGSQTVILSGTSTVERQMSLTFPAAPAREALIPASFDLEAFDQMFRGTGRLQRWTYAPSLVILTTVMQYSNFGSQEEFFATNEHLTDAEVELLITHLTEGLGILTANTFTAFSSVERENPSNGTRVNVFREGQIVVGRYRGIQSLANTVGLGRFGTDAVGKVGAGMVLLDRDYDRTSDFRRLLRIHELGHALGYLHVTTRASIMYPSIGPEPSTFDRQAALIGFQRTPGNQSPDNDIAAVPPSGNGGLFGGNTTGVIRAWAPSPACQLRSW
jgi:hypothetical protein